MVGANIYYQCKQPRHFRRNCPQLNLDMQMDSQVQSQTVNQPKVTTSGGEGTSDVKQNRVVERP